MSLFVRLSAIFVLLFQFGCNRFDESPWVGDCKVADLAGTYAGFTGKDTSEPVSNATILELKSDGTFNATDFPVSMDSRTLPMKYYNVDGNGKWEIKKDQTGLKVILVWGQQSLRSPNAKSGNEQWVSTRRDEAELFFLNGESLVIRITTTEGKSADPYEIAKLWLRRPVSPSDLAHSK